MVHHFDCVEHPIVADQLAKFVPLVGSVQTCRNKHRNRAGVDSGLNQFFD
jgi:hypothetical protein